jgi:DNA-binding transcriptional LysR family regulator
MNLLESLRYLAALQQHRHFGRAAQACHITQPALSNAIRALESEFGVTIVRRGRQYEGLTPEGELALTHAHRMLHDAESLRQALASAVGAPQGQLQIGVVPSAMPVAVRFAARLREAQPGLRPVLRSLSSPEIEAGLDTLSLDLGLGYPSRPEVAQRRLAVWPQYDEHSFVLQRAADAAAPFALGEAMTWADAAALPLVLLTPEMHQRALVDDAFRQAGVLPAPVPVMQTNSVLALVLAVRAGGADRAGGGLASVLPGSLVDTVREQPGLLAQPLVAPVVGTPVAFLSNRAGQPTLALQAALALARSADWLAEVGLHSGTLAA